MTRGGHRNKLPGTVVALGVVSLLTDVAGEMVAPLLPLFLTTVLGAGALALGWIEGAAEATSSLLKLYSGRLADRAGRNRPLVLAGYTISSIFKPLMAAAMAPWHVLALRIGDRVGKGIRSSPRDALIAASVPGSRRGTAFGFHRAMDHAGAVAGPLIAWAVLALWTRDLRTLFWLAAIPGALAVAVLALSVREAPRAAPATPLRLEPLRRGPGPRLARLLIPLAIFTLGNASDLFLLLKAGGTLDAMESLPLLWVALHVVKSLTSLLGGRLVDRFGPLRLLSSGWIVYAAVYTAFAFAETQLAMWCLFIVYGLHHGLTEGAEKALVASLAPPETRGTAFGWLHLTIGVVALPAGLLFGGLWQAFGSSAAFLTGAGLAMVATVLLIVLRPTALPVEDEAGA